MPAGQARELPFAIDPLRHRPRIGVHEAAAVAGELWGLKGHATPLPGERDANFLLEGDSGERFVLKVSSASERPERLALQQALIARARERDPALRLPEAVPTTTGALPGRRDFGGRGHRVRLFRYLEGLPLSAFRRRPHASLVSTIPNWTSWRFPGRRPTLPPSSRRLPGSSAGRTASRPTRVSPTPYRTTCRTSWLCPAAPSTTTPTTTTSSSPQEPPKRRNRRTLRSWTSGTPSGVR